VSACLLVVAMTVFSHRSKFGLALLAISEDREAAELRGINVRALAFAAFAAAGVLAGVAGLLIGPETFAVSTLSASLAIKGFVVLAIGGFGSMPGTLVGGLLVGQIEAYTARYVGSNYVNIAIFALLILILMLRPAGLFVRAKERTV
jgi:branched-chain amino acid transport system permease protein